MRQRLTTLGDPTRGRILALLDEHELAVSELQRVLKLPQSTVSRHLRILADEGWLCARARGASRRYRSSESLPREARRLWELVRTELAKTRAISEDRERLVAVLAERVERSRAFFTESAGSCPNRS